jgi:arylsulfatase A-like enzyme
MTATYPSTHGMWDCTHTQRREWVNVADRLTYFSQRLAEAGYRNGYFGKWHVEQTNELGRFGWHEHDHRCGGCRPAVIEGTEVIVPRPGYRDYLLAAAGRAEEPFHHPAFDKGIDFLRRHAAECPGHPFCCFVSTAEPHDPYVPPKSFLDLYDVARIAPSPTLRDELAGKPEALRRMQGVWRGLSDDDWRFISAAYWATVSFLDAEIGRILDALKDSGFHDNTIVVVTADHGDMLGGHGLAAKGVATSYEEVYNIPLLVRAPGFARGREDADHLVSLVDLAPTLLDLCGASPLPDPHGRSLRPVLDGSADPADWQDAYAEFFGQRFVYTQRIVWHGPWKYVFSPGGIDELYHLPDDPHETRNLIASLAPGAPIPADFALRHVLHDLLRRMWRKMHAIGDHSLFNTHYATLRTAPLGPEEASRPS